MELYRTNNLEDFVSHSVSFIETHYHGGAIGISGGKTPVDVYRAISLIPRFTETTYVAVDERYVPPDHPDANAMLWQGTFPHVLNFDTTLPIDKSLAQFEAVVRPFLPLDICILGMGPDGHTASLFPHSPALHTDRIIAHTSTEHFAVRDRLTMTFSAIMQSHAILLLLRGEDKGPALTTLLQEKLPIEEFPATHLLGHPRLQIIYLST